MRQFTAQKPLNDDHSGDEEEKRAKRRAAIAATLRQPSKDQSEYRQECTQPTVRLHCGFAAKPQPSVYPPEPGCDDRARCAAIYHGPHGCIETCSSARHYEQLSERGHQEERDREVDRGRVQAFEYPESASLVFSVTA
nr:hypothetical protein [Novosphingobium pentaromativorans]